MVCWLCFVLGRTLMLREVCPTLHIPFPVGPAPEDIPVVPTTSGPMWVRTHSCTHQHTPHWNRMLGFSYKIWFVEIVGCFLVVVVFVGGGLVVCMLFFFFFCPTAMEVIGFVQNVRVLICWEKQQMYNLLHWKLTSSCENLSNSFSHLSGIPLKDGSVHDMICTGYREYNRLPAIATHSTNSGNTLYLYDGWLEQPLSLHHEKHHVL